MLIMRQEQMEVFRGSARRAFEESMVAQLGAGFPLVLNTVGPGQLRKTVQLGMERAAGHGFDRRGPVRLYLELMLWFGSYFDTDPQYPWAAAILADREAGSQLQRAGRLYARTLDYQAQVSGPGGASMLNALKNIRAHISQPPDFASEELVSAMLAEIALIWPEKSAYVGSDALSALIRKGGQGARNIRFTTPRGMALVVLLMLVLGHGCGADPLYPWIAETLRDGSTVDPEAKAKRLEARSMAWLEQQSSAMQSAAAGVTGSPVPAAPGTVMRDEEPCDAIIQEGPPDGVPETHPHPIIPRA